MTSLLNIPADRVPLDTQASEAASDMASNVNSELAANVVSRSRSAASSLDSATALPGAYSVGIPRLSFWSICYEFAGQPLTCVISAGCRVCAGQQWGSAGLGLAYRWQRPLEPSAQCLAWPRPRPAAVGRGAPGGLPLLVCWQPAVVSCRTCSSSAASCAAHASRPSCKSAPVCGVRAGSICT